MVAELTALRDQIDEVDKALLNLLAKRLELVAEVGEVKSRFGLPIYVPEREASMLASRRAEAEALGVPPDLIEDVLRRVMRESYSSENDKGFKTLCPSLRPVVIVGGGGQMGRLFEKMLALSGYQVRILEQHDWDRAADIVADAGMVIVSVPIHVTEQVIGKLPPLPKDCILVDLASVKMGHYRPCWRRMMVRCWGYTRCSVRTAVAWQSKLWSGVMDVSRKHTNGFWSKFRSGALGCIVLALSSTIRIWRLFRLCATLLLLLMGCTWQKKMFSLSNFWRSLRRFTALNWRWLGDCLLRIRSFMPTLLCRQSVIWR